MSIGILVRPRAIAWSRNTIEYLFQYSLPSAGDKLHVQIQDANTLVSFTEVSYPIDATVSSGYVDLRLEDLMHPLTSYSRPVNPPNSAYSPQDIREMGGNIAKLKIRFRAAPTGYPVSWTQDNVTLYVMRGGIGDLSHFRQISVNSFGTALPLPRSSHFLTNVPSGRLQTASECGWLLYLSTDTNAQRVQYYVDYMDGSSAVFSRSPLTGGIVNMQYRTWYIPTGVQQAGLDPTNIGVRFVNIQVEKDNGGGVWAAVDNYVINIDMRPNYNALCLYYRNSVGGWDQITARGMHESSSEADRKELNAPYPYANGANPYYDSTIRPRWQLNTGYLSKEHYAALDDLLTSTECALLSAAGDWLPVRVTSKSLTPLSTKDGSLYSTVIEIESSGTFTALPRQFRELR